jgi:uncharacterized protein (TIGR00369 family)
MNTHFSKLEKMYLAAPVNRQTYTGTQIQVSEGRAEISWNILPDFHHAAGSLHGSVYFKLLDDAAFFAAQSEVTDVFILTTAFHINFLRPVRSGEIKAIGELRFRSKTVLTGQAVLYDGKGREIGLGTGNFMKSTVPLNPEIGYTS